MLISVTQSGQTWTWFVTAMDLPTTVYGYMLLNRFR